MSNLLKSLFVVALTASTAEAINMHEVPQKKMESAGRGDPIDGDKVANYCETSADCGGNLGTGFTCGWYKRHEGTREGRCILTAMCGKNAKADDDRSLMICPDLAA